MPKQFAFVFQAFPSISCKSCTGPLGISVVGVDFSRFEPTLAAVLRKSCAIASIRMMEKLGQIDVLCTSYCSYLLGVKACLHHSEKRSFAILF